MKLAIHCANLTWPGGPEALAPTLARVAKVADEGGVSTLTMMDHWFQMENLGGPPEPMLEGYTSLGFLAGQTKDIELGLLVTGVTYRHPGLLAKIATTLDVLSGGRAMLGLGAAWYEREHLGLGVPYPSTSERFERLEEALQVCRLMFAGEGGTFEGRHYQLAEATNVPAPLRPGGPRVLVGGSGERKTLRLVAQYADACNLFGFEPEEMRHKIEVLDRHCADVGREPGEVSRTAIVGVDPLEQTDEFLRIAAAYSALGIEQLWVGPQADDPVGSTERICEELLPRLAQLG
jgi:F420-dependent oxidoreductase-like protein